ncbi:uncharacterized protein LOC125238167 [Leguminivora glycinivorella]|uniref:uncharacterized protein LOC125238167 n=1 Tax=Leguminivora glycinivorella TaxID=1035111 RepID=UPI00200EA739|nr:uncharacterized protein LOC125238167 [Leguminivora glycinivorella]
MNEKCNEVLQMMEERRIDVLCVNETKRKGCDTTTHGAYTAYWSGVPSSDRASKGVGVILSARMAECVNEFECVSPRLIWIRMKVGMIRIFVLGVYAPVDQGAGNSQHTQDERRMFWDEVRDVLRVCKDNERIIMLGDFNSWVGVKRVGCERVLGMHGDDRVNENGRNLLEICLEWNLCVANTMFSHKWIHLYTREAENVRKSMIDFIIVDDRMKKNVLDARVYRGSGIHTDHFLVMCRISGLFKGWRSRPRAAPSVLDRIKVECLQEESASEEYVSKLKNEFESLDDIDEIDELWSNFKNKVVSVARVVCGVSKRNKGGKVKNVWFDKEVQEAVCEKKKLWRDWLAARANQRAHKASFDEVNVAKDNYRSMKVRVKELVKRKKDELNDQMDERLSQDFQTNIKFFWKSVRLARGKSSDSELKSVKNSNGSLLNGEECILKRWQEYFESLFEREEANMLTSGLNGNLSMDEISMDEIVKALKGMKSGKAAGYDKVSAEMLKAGQGIVASQLYRLFNLCFSTGRVPKDWCKAVIVPLYKGKGSRLDCKNYRGISLLSIVGKLYAKVLIERVVRVTDEKNYWSKKRMTRDH